EEALAKFRREDFDAAQKKLEELAQSKCGTAVKQAVDGLGPQIQRARSLKSAYAELLKTAGDAEREKRTSDAIGAYNNAQKTYQELSALLQAPERPLPNE